MLGFYCVQVLGISTFDVPAVATPEVIGSFAGGVATVQVARDSGVNCPNLSDFAVHTFDGGSPSNAVPFNIVIP